MEFVFEHVFAHFLEQRAVDEVLRESFHELVAHVEQAEGLCEFPARQVVDVARDFGRWGEYAFRQPYALNDTRWTCMRLRIGEKTVEKDDCGECNGIKKTWSKQQAANCKD